MQYASVLAGLGLLAGTVSAQTQGAQNVVYWGQNGGGTIENNDLATYCTSTSGIDVLVLSFLYQFGENGNIPSGTIGQSCFISTAGEGQNCDDLKAAIGTCQSNGVKIILSIGGASSAYSLSSNEQASEIGQYLWESYGNSGNTTVERPFGDLFVNGFDFDIEESRSSEYFPAMIDTLRQNFQTDSSNSYYITGAPQCPIPEPNMGSIIGNSTFDYLFVQFYNNNNYTYPCALPFNGNAAFNYDEWVNFTSATPSKDAKIFIGVPASPDAANGTPAGATYYITPDQLSQLIGEYGTAERFGGIMMWSAGFSDTNVNDGCTYAQEAHAILANGAPCNGSPSGGSHTTTTAPAGQPTTSTTTPASQPTTTTASSGGSSPSGAAGAYDQCGGTGYTGPTTCVSGYVCTQISGAYSQCNPASKS